jgi:hypothetical protein
LEHQSPAITATRVRLVSAETVFAGPVHGKRVFRPLVIRPAILVRQAGSEGPWRVDVEGDLLLPACPPTERGIAEVVGLHEALGRTCRIAAALALPADSRESPLRRLAGPRRRPIDIFGWAIMIQRPGMTGTAVVDPHEHRAAMPAFYECPLQLIDRSDFLTARGIHHRPLAIVVRPEDVEPEERDNDRVRHRHRFPADRDGPTPCSIADLLGS